MKRCKVCGEEKPLEAFYRAPTAKDGYRSDCKACNLAAKAARYRANPEPTKARVRRWQQENPERHRETQRRLRAKPEQKEKARAYHLGRAHGLTQAEYDAMLAEQGGGCAICERPPRPDIALHVDHDHLTGRRRALLCFRCNNALGDFDDNADLLLAAAAYLMRFDVEAERLAEITRQRVADLPRRQDEPSVGDS